MRNCSFSIVSFDERLAYNQVLSLQMRFKEAKRVTYAVTASFVRLIYGANNVANEGGTWFAKSQNGLKVCSEGREYRFQLAESSV